MNNIKCKKLSRLNAQAMLEYSVFVVCVIAALIAMQVYIKRGIEGRIKQSSDDIGEQYASKNTTSDITTVTTSHQSETSEVWTVAIPGVGFVDSNGMPIYSTKSTVTSPLPETTTRSGSESTGRFEDTLFE